MDTYLDIFQQSFSGYYQYLVREVMNPHWGNYFYWLIGISLVFWSLEVLIPWRKNQKNIRKDKSTTGNISNIAMITATNNIGTTKTTNVNMKVKVCKYARR